MVELFFFSIQNNPQNLPPSYKMELGFWDYFAFGQKNKQNQNKTIHLYGISFMAEVPGKLIWVDNRLLLKKKLGEGGCDGRGSS